MSRELLTAPRTLYVRSDALYTDAPGRIDSQAGACKTWQQAVDIAAELDFNNQTVTIQHGSEGAHTFTAPIAVPQLTGGGFLRLQGQDAVGSTHIQTTDEPWAITATGPNTVANLTNMKISALTTSAVGTVCAMPRNGAILSIENGVIFGSAVLAHLLVHDMMSMLYVLGVSYTIAAGAAYHVLNSAGSVYIEQCTVTLTGTPAWASAGIACAHGYCQMPSNTYVGSATGQRYAAYLNGVINTGTGSGTYLPGSVAGSSTTGGQYA